jgi:hypothetical protein
MNKLITLLVAAFSFLVAFTGTAVAADVSTDGAPLLDLAKPVLDAVMGGHWLAGAALALVLAVSLIRRYGAKRFPVLTTDAGGTALTFLTSLGGAVGTAALAGSAPSLALLWTALGVAAVASGGYTALKRLAAPALRWLEAKAPAWARPFVGPVIAVLLWFVDRPSAIAKAKAAGDAAVEANPPTGAAGVVGEPKNWP